MPNLLCAEAGAEPPPFESNEFFSRRTRYCVCITVLNEGERLKNQLRRMQPRAGSADIVVADGRSSDGSTEADMLRPLGVRALLSTGERGLSTALRMGIAYAMREGYEGMITMDGNGKDGVEAVPDFIRALECGWDLTQGSRFMEGGCHKNTPWDRYIGIRFVMVPVLALTCGSHYTDPTNGFRALSMRFLRDRRVQPVRRLFVDFNLQHYLIYRAARLGFRITEIPVTRVYPDDGTVPTKILGVRLKALDLFELIFAILGRYNPR